MVIMSVSHTMLSSCLERQVVEANSEFHGQCVTCLLLELECPSDPRVCYLLLGGVAHLSEAAGGLVFLHAPGRDSVVGVIWTLLQGFLRKG